MERVLERLHHNLGPVAESTQRLAALSVARSVISNPDSSDSTRRSAVDAVIRFLDNRDGDPAFLRPAVKILGEAAALHQPLAPDVVAALKPFLDAGNSLAADAVAALAGVVESDEEGRGFALVASVLDEGLVLSLTSSAIMAVRSRVLELLVRSVDSGRGSSLLRQQVLLRVLLGLAGDLHPSVRRGALDGLRGLLKGTEGAIDRWIVDCCYDRGSRLLKDEEEAVRMAAIQLVSECGRAFEGYEEDLAEQRDTMFIQLCSMARDMCMKVRVEAYNALGKVRLISESVLLQSLSKKILRNQSEKCLADVTTKVPKFPSSSAAGAFVHGIEDEFYEVRAVACKSLGALTIFSNQFAVDALNLLMDMLNDDSETVQLQTLQTLFHMATHDRLTIQEKHMHMFLGLLSDNSALIRQSARKLLHLMKLPDFSIFKTTIDCLIRSLVRYLEEEEDVFVALALIGKNHRKFSAKLAKEFAEELVLPCKGELTLDSIEVASKLVLSISSSFLNNQHMVDIPVILYSYAIPFVGRISRALKGGINQDYLLAYLCKRSGIAFSNVTSESKEANDICGSLSLVHDTAHETKCRDKKLNLPEFSSSHEQGQDKGHWSNEDVQSIKLTLKTVGEVLQLIKSNHTHEAQRILRSCRVAVEGISWSTDISVSAFVEFALEYIQIMQLISEFLDTLNPNKSCAFSMQKQDLSLESLHLHLRKLRYCFQGLDNEEECHILELTLLGFVFRLSKFGIGSDLVLKKLHSVLSRLEILCEENSFGLSDFAKEIKSIYAEEKFTEVFHSRAVHKLLDLFYTERIPFNGNFRHKKAKLRALNNDSENPLAYVSGLPVGIHFQITLYNTLGNDRVWLVMAVGESVQYVFLDFWRFDGHDILKICNLDVPFYRTPNAASFLIKACVALECPCQEVTDWRRSQGGPLDDITLLSEESYVYLVSADKR